MPAVEASSQSLTTPPTTSIPTTLPAANGLPIPTTPEPEPTKRSTRSNPAGVIGPHSPTTPRTTATLPTRQAVRRSPSRATTETTMKSTRSNPVGVVGPQLPTTVQETLSLTGAVNSDCSLLVAPEE